MQIINRAIYVACDGTEFLEEEEAKFYEASLVFLRYFRALCSEQLIDLSSADREQLGMAIWAQRDNFRGMLE